MTHTIEYRLYYDELGNVLFYTCEKPEGNFIIIDRDTYASCRFNIKVVDGKIVNKNDVAIISKLVPSDEGISCSKHDVCILTDIDSVKWKSKSYEHRYN